MSIPTNGDVLKLSEVAWKISRIFNADRNKAPIEFKDVETKLNALAKALKGLAEALHIDGDSRFLQEADEHIQHGIQLVLDSCDRTVNDLDSFVDHHQVIKKHRTVGGFAIERTWDDLVFSKYESMIWTAEGGDIHSLQELLQMHTSSISLLIHALSR